MKKRIKDIIIGILIGCVLVGTTPVLADTITKSIDVVLDTVKVQINGENLDANTILYNGTTYLPMRKVAEAVGKEVEWNQSTMTANIVDKSNVEVSLPTIISYGFENETYIVNFSDGFTVGIDTKQNEIPGYKSVLINANVKNMDTSSIISIPEITGFSKLSEYKYEPIEYKIYSASIPDEYKEGIKKYDFYENYNSKTYTESFGGAVYFDINAIFDGLNYDDGVHQCVLYLK